ncbi:hypothetical protein [Microcella sp.]|uniref:hypothetical protein n=1 Tax=Microcella sp. TaxID=1913979 RepID=UPI00299F56B0|nr:hypothetical protein [Microcella sp.]MDX2026386.1 hypothetical protein [Microcella sp.]
MTLRFDPRRPIVWRTPHSLQIGVDPVLARLDGVSDGDAQLVDALAVGIPRSGLDALAELAAIAPDRVDAVLAVLAGALHTTAAPTDAPRIDVVGTGPGAQRIAAVLLEAGYAATLRAPGAGPARRRAPHAAVLVSAHVIDPAEHQRWLRADVPHLPVVFSEVSVRVGPLVDPGRSACLACVEHHRTDADSTWPAVAAQLWGAAAAAEAPALATEAAVEVLRLVRGRTVERSIRIDADSGERTSTRCAVSERCGCHGLAGLSALSAPESRRENGSERDRPAPPSHEQPTTAREPFALA